MLKYIGFNLLILLGYSFIIKGLNWVSYSDSGIWMTFLVSAQFIINIIFTLTIEDRKKQALFLINAFLILYYS
jgi:hypothetical protein